MSLLSGVLERMRTLFLPKAPNAARVWQANGGRVQHAYWLFCAPVHMLLGRDSFFLTTPAPAEVSAKEAASLIESLNQHFLIEGYHFYLQNSIWFLGLNHDPQITTTAIEFVINKDVAAHFPQGEGALKWAKLQNEIQMLLFSHSVNEQREKEGQPIINSLWCYGVSQNDVSQSPDQGQTV